MRKDAFLSLFAPEFGSGVREPAACATDRVRVAGFAHELRTVSTGSVRAMPVLAAIDCGTNSTRLLVSDGGRAIERRMVITRLGRGVDATGRLDPDAIERTIDVLREYQGLIDEHGVERTRIVATSAVRDASNAEDFFAAASAVVGARPELLSGVEEGELSFAGATAELDPGDGPFLVVDIGGGSTECMVGTDHVEEVRSFDLGCVRLTEKHLEHDPPAPEELSNAIAEATSWFDDLVREVPAVTAARTVVGLAGTISTVASVEIGLAEWDRDVIHHYRLSRERDRGRVPHAGDGVARGPAPQPRTGARAGRRDRRRLLRAGGVRAAVGDRGGARVRERHP